jgi:Arc/MetJ-type ribon-helix-helix transcriptional regulator
MASPDSCGPRTLEQFCELSGEPSRFVADAAGHGSDIGELRTDDDHLALSERAKRRCAWSCCVPTLLPDWYHDGMSKQIAVRLPDDLVEFVDGLVEAGVGRSRAAVVAGALERERRRTLAARDAAILARTGPDPELAGLAEHVAGLGLPLD